MTPPSAAPHGKRVIWKYPLHLIPRHLSSQHAVEMPRGARILHLALQDGAPTLWAEAQTDSPVETREFIVLGTGHPIQNGAEYVGTVHDPPFVWHILERLAPEPA